MRDRLAQLIRLNRVCFDVNGDDPESVYQQTAQQMIRQGVVAFPCSVGDLVYTISRGRVKEWRVYFLGVNAVGECCMRVADEPLNNSREFWDRDIGEFVFLTPQDAERVIEQRKKAVKVQ